MSNVDHPQHYNSGGIECIDAMISAYGIDKVMAFCELNAFKYTWRAARKNGAEDMQKAHWYIDKWLELDKIRTSDIPAEIDGCENCKYNTVPEECYPCSACRNSVVYGSDEYKRRPNLWCKYHEQ